MSFYRYRGIGWIMTVPPQMHRDRSHLRTCVLMTAVVLYCMGAFWTIWHPYAAAVGEPRQGRHDRQPLARYPHPAQRHLGRHGHRRPQHLFEPFQQERMDARSVSPGSGSDLAIAKALEAGAGYFQMVSAAVPITMRTSPTMPRRESLSLKARRAKRTESTIESLSTWTTTLTWPAAMA